MAFFAVNLDKLPACATPSEALVRLMASGGYERLGRGAKLAERGLEHQEVRDATTARYKLLDALRPHSLPRTSFCRRKRVQPTVQIQLHFDGSVRFAGLETCGSVWGCPCCAARIYAERSGEVTLFAETWRAAGGYTYMASFTLRHGIGDDLERTRTGLANAWRRFWQGRSAKEQREGWSIRHWVRAVEVTFSFDNGWHPHIHVLFATDRVLTEQDEREMALAWQECVRRELGPENEPTLSHGVKLTVSTNASYLEKLGLEIAQIASKTPKLPGHRTPWQIGQNAAEGDAKSVQLWRHYVAAMKGARQLTWSVGTKQAFHIKHATDEDIANDANPPEGGVAHIMAEFEGRTWDQYARTIRHWTSIVVAAAMHRYALTELAKLPGVLARSPPGRVQRPQTANPPAD